MTLDGWIYCSASPINIHTDTRDPGFIETTESAIGQPEMQSGREWVINSTTSGKTLWFYKIATDYAGLYR